jgi:hypothetical protein
MKKLISTSLLMLATITMVGCFEPKAVIHESHNVASDELVSEMMAYLESKKMDGKTGLAFMYCENKTKKNCIKKVLTPKNGQMNFKLITPIGNPNFTPKTHFAMKGEMTTDKMTAYFEIGDKVFPEMKKPQLKHIKPEVDMHVPEIKVNKFNFVLSNQDSIKYSQTGNGELIIVKF